MHTFLTVSTNLHIDFAVDLMGSEVIHRSIQNILSKSSLNFCKIISEYRDTLQKVTRELHIDTSDDFMKRIKTVKLC